MTTSYPAALDSFTNPTGTDELDDEVGTRTHSEMHADVNDAVEAIEAELGTDPSGSEATVKARIAATETVANAAVQKSLFDAHTILAANTDNTPAAVTVAEQRIVGRITGGNIDDLTAAQAGNVLLGGAWTSYTPAITALDPFGSFGGAVNPTMGTGASLTGAYVQVGRLVIGRCSIQFGTSAAAGTGFYGISLPVTPRSTDQPIGVGYMLDASDSYRFKIAPVTLSATFSTTLATIAIHDGQAAAGSSPASHFAPWAWADSDAIFFAFTYEAAADA